MLRNKRKKKTVVRMDTLIGQQTYIKGDVEFNGGLRIDGTVTGKVNAIDDIDAVLTLSEQGSVIGQIQVPNVIIHGTVHGDIYVVGHLELAEKAKVKGNVYYHLLEMAVGAEVNGQLIRISADNPDYPEQPEQITQQQTTAIAQDN